jgi:translation initiation factor 1A
LKYWTYEARLLKAYGELPANTRINVGIAGGFDEEDDGDDDYFEFMNAGTSSAHINFI